MIRGVVIILGIVMRGLDPRIHAEVSQLRAHDKERKPSGSMDCRVKPGKTNKWRV